MSRVTLHEGDNRVTLRRLIDEGVRVHSCVSDPPYGLTSITKRFGKIDLDKPTRTNERIKSRAEGFSRIASGGFMNVEWDGTGIERDPEFWRLVWEILLPGGYCLAFSGSRTGHWQAVAMEQAGFIMHPMIGWVYGQGFPKPTNLDGEWKGWGYGTQSLKPALEPIYMAQKPFSEKTGPANLLKHGVGAVNIDECRAGGRHPANLIHDGSDEVVALFPNSNGSGAARNLKRNTKDRADGWGMDTGGDTEAALRDAGSGSAARFFNSFPADPDPDPLIYHVKASKADRAGSLHPTVKPVPLIEHLVRLVTPPGGICLDPFAGSGTTGEACRRVGVDCILMEAHPQYADDIRRRFNLSITDPLEELFA